MKGHPATLYGMAVVAALLVPGCSKAPSAEQACYEATRAYAEATDRYLNAQHKTAADAWLETHLAAKWWKEAVCPKPRS